MDEIEVIEVDSSANSEEEPIPDTLTEENNNDADVDEVESNAETEPTLEIINVSEEDVEVINIESAFPALGESNEALRHTLLTCRDSADQHPISAITGLRAELNSIEALKTVLSDKRVLAEYYPWDDGNGDLEDRIGYFVKVVNSNDSSDHIQITNSDIFGVTIEYNTAGFVGGQASPARGSDYGLVAIFGNVPVLRESTVAAGDYVIPNANGIAKKSNVDRSEATTYINTQISNYNNELTRINTRINALNALDTLTQDQQEWLGELEDYKELVDVKILELQAELARKNIRYGYHVTSIGNDGGTLYANIDLVPQILPLYTFQNEISDMEDRLISDEYNITVAMNRANNAYELADSSANSANSAAQSASSASQSASTSAQQASSASASAAASQAFIQEVITTAATNAETIRTQAVNVANNAVSQVNAVKSKTDNISVYTDSTGTYLDFQVDMHEPQGGHLSGTIEAMENDIEENQSAILQSSNQIQLMVSSMDKYSVGPLSQIYGLTYAEICTILPKEFVYVPTVTHTENYLKVNDQDSAPSWAANTYYRYDDEDEEYVLTTSAPSNWSTTYKNYYKNHSVTFTQYYAYTWDGEEWNEPVDENVFFNGGAVPTATSVFIYWYSGSGDEMITGIDDTKYLSKTLHKWMDNKWTPVATLDNNSLSRSVSLIKQTADSILQTVTNTKGDAASIKTWVDENQAAVQQVATWKGQLGNDTLATVKTWASEGSTGVSQIAQNIGTNGIVTAASIVTAINNQTGESIIDLDADRINFDGKTIAMSASNNLTITAGNGFRLDKNGVYWTTESNPTKMVYSQVLQTNPPANDTQYSSFPASSTVRWHKNLTSADKYASETTDGGATWGAVRKIVGEDGTPGQNGTDGESYYTWIKYADDASGTNMSDNSSGKSYIGIAYNKSTSTESTTPSDYTWSLIKGSNGTTYYTWIKYADDANGTNMNDDPLNKDYIGIAYNKTTAVKSNTPSDYTWSLFKGSDGVAGANGTNGITYYTWIKYADDVNGTNMSDNPNGRTYMGIAYNKLTSTESTIASDYAWSLIKGSDGTSVNIKGNCYISSSPTVGTTYSIYSSSNHSTQITGANVGDGYIDETYGNLFVCTDVDGHTFTCVGRIKGDDGYTPLKGVDYDDGTSIIFKGSYANPPSNPQDGWSYYNTTAKASYVYQDNAWYQMSVDGINGQNGSDGTSIIFKGSYASPPLNPQDGWSYYNTTQKASYVMQDGSWYQMSVDGVDGQNGTDGASIVWKGDLSTPPASPSTNWVYRDTDDGKVYIYNGTGWELMVLDGNDGADGTNGSNGLSVFITYHDNGAFSKPSNPTGNGTTGGWHTNATSSSVWMSQKISDSANNGTWGEPIRIKGSDGLSIVWKGESSTAPSNPQDNWVYKDTDDGIVYIYDSSGSGWEPMVLDGSDGVNGANGTNGLSVFITYNDTDSSTTPSTPTGNGTTGGWHTAATSSSIWMSQKVSASATDGTWGTPIRIKGNSGTSAYFFVRYSANANGNPMTTSPQSDTAYMGVATTTTNSAPTSYTAYTWTKIKGNDGADGADGQDGQDGHTIQVVRAYKLGTSIPPTITHNGNALPTGWTASPSGVTASNPYEYVSECVVTDGVYGTWSSPAVYAHFGSDATVNADNVFNALTSNGTKFGLFNSSNNKLYINASYINTGELRVQNSSNTVFSASVSSGTCTIGGWKVSSTSLKSGSDDNNYIYLASDLSSASYWIRAVYGGNTKFGVKKDGELYATGANISGTITANAGSIGGWDISSVNISAVKDSVHLYLASPASSAGYWIRSYKDESGGGTTTYFGVKRDGTLYANGADISGTITAESGSFSRDVTVGGRAISGWINSSGYVYNVHATSGYIGYAGGDSWSIGTKNKDGLDFPCLYCSSSWKINNKATSASVYLTPLYVEGNYGSGGSTTTWYKICSAANSGSSDSRIKNDITDLTDESFDLFFDNLKAKTFSYAENSGIIDGGKTHIGFVAQDILQNLSDNNIDNSALVEDCEYYSLRYNEFTALNTWQIQKLKTRVSELEAKLAELENKIG